MTGEETPVGFDLRGLRKDSLLEWDDHLVAVAVAGGCNWRCPYCHSWRYVIDLPNLPPLDPEDLIRHLEEQAGWLDGVVFSGGEATLQPGLPDLVRRVKGLGVKVKLHSNGSRPEVVRRLLSEHLIDCLALDLKTPLDNRLLPLAGTPPEEGVLDRVRETFALARDGGVDREYHTTLFPPMVDRGSLGEMADFLAQDGVWFLQQFSPLDCLSPIVAGQQVYGTRELDQLEEIARSRHPRVVMRRRLNA
jgi:pyruvate formate lyase activating enzyme